MRSLFPSLVLATAVLTAGAVEIDGITATVGAKSILRSDVMSYMRHNGGVDESRFETARAELIERELILRAAEATKLSMQDWVIEDRVQSIIDSGFGGDRNRLIESLAQEKISYADWRARIREDLIINAMRWNFVYKYAKATPAEMRAEYREHPERYSREAKVTVSIILLKPEDAVRRDEVMDAVRNDSFAAAAARFSADSHASQGGVWKDVTPANEFRRELCDEIAKMKVGELSQWIEIGGWSFLVHKDAESAAQAKSFTDAYEEIERNVREANAKRLTEAWVERLKAETFIRLY